MHDSLTHDLQKRSELLSLEKDDRRRFQFALFALFCPLLSWLAFFMLKEFLPTLRFFLGIYFHEALFAFVCSLARSFQIIEPANEPPSDYALSHRRTEKVVMNKNLIWLLIGVLGFLYLFV